MASAHSAARLCALTCRRVPQLSRLPRLQVVAKPFQTNRTISTTTSRWAEDDKQEPATEQLTEVDLKSLREMYNDKMTPEVLGQLDELAKVNGFNSVDELANCQFAEGSKALSGMRGFNEDLVRFDVGKPLRRGHLWHDPEDFDSVQEDLDPFDEDDMTSLAHNKLDELREQRHFNRLAVWEMPLLAKLAKPFEPPTEKQVLRWRFTTYMGETHPAESKVVVEFCPEDLGLTKVQTEKLKKLVGPRYNPEKEIVKMSCENYEHQAQNQSYLLKLIDDLIAAAKDSKDTFEDIPLDVRHHTKSKPKPRFPKEWRLTEERRAELDAIRQRIAIEDVKKADDGLLMDGGKKIESYLMLKAAEEQEKQREAEALTISTGRGGRTATAARARR